MQLIPLPGRVLVEPILQSDVKQQALQAVIPGMVLAAPDNKRHSFEGIPDRGKIYSLAADYDGDLKSGMVVVFKDNAPKAVKYQGLKLFSLEVDHIMAVLADA